MYITGLGLIIFLIIVALADLIDTQIDSHETLEDDLDRQNSAPATSANLSSTQKEMLISLVEAGVAPHEALKAIKKVGG